MAGYEEAFKPFGKDYDSHTPSDPRDETILKLQKEVTDARKERDEAVKARDLWASQYNRMSEDYADLLNANAEREREVTRTRFAEDHAKEELRKFKETHTYSRDSEPSCVQRIAEPESELAELARRQKAGCPYHPNTCPECIWYAAEPVGVPEKPCQYSMPPISQR